MMKLRTLAAMAAGILAATLSGFEARGQPVAPIEARNVVLIHGAWADGSSWAEVIPRLQAAGLKVTAVQNPLTTLADSSQRRAAHWRFKMAQLCWLPIPGAALSLVK